MIRFVNCIRKHEKITDEEFRNLWNSPDFDELLFQVALFAGADRYTKNFSLKVEANIRLLEDRGGLKPFDGIIELVWEAPTDLLAAYDSDEGKVLLNEIIKYEEQFVNFSDSSAFFVETQIVMVRDSREDK